jgi:hypothetical protein
LSGTPLEWHGQSVSQSTDPISHSERQCNSCSAAMSVANEEIEALVAQAGVQRLVLQDPQRVVCDDVWTEERERLAAELLARDASSIPAFWQGGLRLP